MAKAVHYSGGIRGRVGGGFTTRLRGWPACGGGIKLGEIVPGTEYDWEESVVTCKKCLRLIAANKAYHDELKRRFKAVENLATEDDRQKFPHLGGHNTTDRAGEIVFRLEKLLKAMSP